MRRLYAWLTHGMVVDLFDHDGETNRRIAWETAFGWKATRFGLGVASVWLNDDGTTSGASYVKKWAPMWDYRK